MKTFPIVPSQYQHLPNIPFIIAPQEYLGNHGALYLVNTKQIYVGDAFLKLLTDRELTALLLHEFGHHIGKRFDHLPKNNVMTAIHKYQSSFLTKDDFIYAGIE